MNSHWSQARPWQLNAALIFLGAGLVSLSHQLVSEYDHFTIGFSGVSGWSAALYVIAIYLVLTQPGNRHTFPIILGVAVACRLIPLFGEPFLSSDVYRYVWDGIVQHAHISPYRYVPGDAALTFLRGPNQEIFDNINRRDYARTIYPPAAQFLFYLITYLSGSVAAMKTIMVLFEGVTLYSLVKLLRALGRPREQSIIYAWCPLLIWEISGSGHLDSAAMAFISLALLFRYRRRPVLTGLTLGIAVMIKFYPIVLLPALLLRRRSVVAGKLRWWDPRGVDLTMPGTLLTVAIIGYVTYSSVGRLVFGFLGGYVQEEGIDTGTRYFLLEFTQHIPGLQSVTSAAYLVFCALIFIALGTWAYAVAMRNGPQLDRSEVLAVVGDADSWLTPDFQAMSGGSFLSLGKAPFLTPAFVLAAGLMLLFSPHYPWYIAWLIPFLTLIPNITILTYVAAMFYLCTTAMAVGSGPKQFLLNEYLYSLIAAAAIIDLALNRCPIHGRLFVPVAEPVPPMPNEQPVASSFRR